MEQLIRYIVENLVENKDAISVTSEEESEKVTVVTVLVDKEDIGRVIGRNGKIANSIRTIIKSASIKSGKRFVIKIGERD